VSAKLKAPETKEPKFEDVVKSAKQAVVLALVYCIRKPGRQERERTGKIMEGRIMPTGTWDHYFAAHDFAQSFRGVPIHAFRNS
jgi:hypothetical protein